MKFGMVTCTTGGPYSALHELTWDKNKKLYCEQHGYEPIVKDSNFKYDPSLIGFDRLEFVIELLESGKYDWLHMVGGDTMITNFTIKLESLVDDNCHFVAAYDCYNLNNDSCLFRASDQIISWLKNIVSLREKYVNYRNAQGHVWYEQQGMIDTLDNIKPLVKIVPQRVLNSYDYYQYPGSVPHIYGRDAFGNDGQWQKGDFLIHWPAIAVSKRLILAHSMLQQVIK